MIQCLLLDELNYQATRRVCTYVLVDGLCLWRNHELVTRGGHIGNDVARDVLHVKVEGNVLWRGQIVVGGRSMPC